MESVVGSSWPVMLQHLLDQVNASARGVEFVAVEHIGRTSRRAKSAMHAGAQNLFRFRNIGIGKLREGEVSLHRQYQVARLHPGPHATGIENALRVEAFADP